MRVNLEKFPDNEDNLTGDAELPTEDDGQRPSSTRRRFTRNGIVGSAVICSLGNRAAWGAVVNGTCLSTVTWTSFRNNDDVFISLHTGQPGDHVDDQLAAEKMLKELSDNFGATEVVKGNKTCIVWEEIEPPGAGEFGGNRLLRQRDRLKAK